jgi:hypothetical protein
LVLDAQGLAVPNDFNSRSADPSLIWTAVEKYNQFFLALLCAFRVLRENGFPGFWDSLE